MPILQIPLEWIMFAGNGCSVAASLLMFWTWIITRRQFKALHAEHVQVMIRLEKAEARLDDLENGTFMRQVTGAYDEVLARAEGYKAQRDRGHQEHLEYRNEVEGNGHGKPGAI